MPITWQLSTGQADITWLERRMKQILEGYAEPIIKYARGRALMSTLPALGDRVHITNHAKLIMKGTIIGTFVREYNPNISDYEEYATILISEVVKDPPYMRGQRRNWTVLSNTN
jgi:hypothetical protein